MSSIADILAKKQYDEPTEVQIIKEFVRETYKSNVSVTVQPMQIVITTKSAALAGTLRMQIHMLKQLCDTDKKLVLRISA